LKSTAGSGYRNSLGWRIFNKLAQAADQRLGWHKLPTPVGLAVLTGVRNILRQRNLHDTGGLPSKGVAEVPPWRPEYLPGGRRDAEAVMAQMVERDDLGNKLVLIGAVGLRNECQEPLGVDLRERARSAEALREVVPRLTSVRGVRRRCHARDSLTLMILFRAGGARQHRGARSLGAP
jgi:hypothetical protein